MNQEYETTIRVNFENYNFRDFHDRLNGAQNNLKYIRERIMKLDDVVKTHGLKNEVFDYTNNHRQSTDN